MEIELYFKIKVSVTSEYEIRSEAAEIEAEIADLYGNCRYSHYSLAPEIDKSLAELQKNKSDLFEMIAQMIRKCD